MELRPRKFDQDDRPQMVLTVDRAAMNVQPAISENWAVNWALQAREIPQGHVVAGLLVDLVADPRQVICRTQQRSRSRRQQLP
ncbi:hypothetical protein [Streptomyces tubercidicus]|uniref:hypothetical protein n=1 Tax=Streptomyces tubercidicus TaxID=47759 RepID=UPI003465DB75